MANPVPLEEVGNKDDWLATQVLRGERFQPCALAFFIQAGLKNNAFYKKYSGFLPPNIVGRSVVPQCAHERRRRVQWMWWNLDGFKEHKLKMNVFYTKWRNNATGRAPAPFELNRSEAMLDDGPGGGADGLSDGPGGGA